MASEKRCLYDVLGLPKDSNPDDIRSAYRRLALQRHPDKLVKSGLSQSEATAQFQELVHAYEVLSDPKERAWYDSHRSQILFADLSPSSSATSAAAAVIPNLFSYFSNTIYNGYSDSGKGFYKVYSDVFNTIYLNEIDFVKKLGLRLDSVPEPPVMGNLESYYAQVTAFYNYWLGFCTVMDFCWVDKYDVNAGANRKVRRLMEEDNKKVRKKAKKEYNETVRGLADFVKKRDKRVIDMVVKKNAELEKKKEEDRERKKKMEREKMEKASKYEDPEWARVQEEEVEEEEEVLEGENKKNQPKELYCVICSKKFKSEKQWKNHEQSKKHKELVAKLRKSYRDEEKQHEKVIEEDEEGVEDLGNLEEGFREDLKIEEEENLDGVDQESIKDENGFEIESEYEDDDEMSGLKAMLSGHKSRNAAVEEVLEAEVEIENDDRSENKSDQEESMEYDNRKKNRRNKKVRKERGQRNGEGATMNDVDESKVPSINGIVEKSSSPANAEESSSQTFTETDYKDEADGQFAKNAKARNKGASKKETNTKSKNSSKGKKQKATEKNTSNVCDQCTEEFESRNQLHKHLVETGHATIKSRR